MTGDAPGCTIRWLRDRLLTAIERLGAHGEVRVRIASDAEITALHEKWRQDRSPTDVLTFDLSQDECLDADIVICADQAEREAGRRGLDPRRELLLYALHGVLHCLGHDDHDDTAYSAMHRLEDEILDAIGVGATFDVPETPA